MTKVYVLTTKKTNNWEVQKSLFFIEEAFCIFEIAYYPIMKLYTTIIQGMHNLFFILACTFSCTPPPAIKTDTHTTTKIDSLLQKVKHEKIDTLKIKTLQHAFEAANNIKQDSAKLIAFTKLGYVAAKTDSTLFLKTSRIGYRLAKTVHDTLAMADIHWNYGIYYLSQNNYERSFIHYHKAWQFFANRNDYYAGKMLYNMAFITGRIKDYTGAEKLLFEAIPIFERLKKYKQLYYCYNHLGAIYESLKEYDEALLQYQRALDYLEHVTPPTLYLQDTRNNIGLLYQKLGHQQTAIDLFTKALQTPNLSAIDPALYARLLDNKTYSLFLQGHNNDIESDFLKALHIRDSLDHTAGQIVSHIHLARFYLQQENRIKAAAYAQQAYTLGSETLLRRDALRALLLLAEIHPENKVVYLKKHIALTKAIQAEERQVRQKFTKIQFETERYIEENKQLLRDKIWSIAAGAAISVILILLFITFRQRAKNKLLAFESQQQRANEQIYLLTLKQQANLEKGRMEERRRIAEDLHDGILARLFGMRLNWEFLRVKGPPTILKKHWEHLTTLQEIEGDIRSLSHDLKHELAKTDTHYVRTLETLVEKWKNLGGFTCHFKASPHTHWEALDSYTKVNVYRVIEEALHNVTKHAQATRVIVNLIAGPLANRLEISDNGKGFTPKFNTKGIGIKNMSSRTEKINGRFLIDSNPGTGTQISITFPKNNTV